MAKLSIPEAAKRAAFPQVKTLEDMRSIGIKKVVTYTNGTAQMANLKLGKIEVGKTIICKQHGKNSKLITNHRYTLEAENDKQFQVEGQWYLKSWFRADTSLTCHSVQGDAIAQRFAIMETECSFASKEWFWTACTRATKAKDVYIYTGTPLLKGLGDRIRRKLFLHQEEDKKKGRAFDLDADWVRKRLKDQNYCCALCHSVMDVMYADLSDEQWSIDRKDNAHGHTKDNCQLAHWGCNRAKGARPL